MNPIDSFIQAVRRRLSLSRAIRTGLWVVLIGAAVMLKGALYFVLRGYAVPADWFAVGGVVTVAGALLAGSLRRTPVAEAAAYADEYFDLKDGLVSQKRFAAENKSGGYFDLQAASTAQALAGQDARSVPVVWPRRMVAGAGILLLATGLTAFKKTDQKILDKLASEELTATNFEEARKLLEEEIEALAKSAGEEESAELDADRLKEMVKDLKSTRDLAEAMQQLAALEEKLKQKEKALDTAKDEALLKKAAEELAKEEDPQARELASKLKKMELKEAAEDLEKMKPENADQAKSLKEQRKQSAKLKAAARKMANAARAQRQNSTAKSNTSRKNGQDPKVGESPARQTKSGEKKESDGESELAEDLENLEMEADEYDAALEELEEMEKQGKMDKSKMEKGLKKGEKLGKSLGKLAGKCKSLGVKRQAKFKLNSLSKKLGQCQGGMGQPNMLQMLMAKSNGLKPGSGSEDSRRQKKDALTDNGNTSQLKGQKGEGPSLTKIEAADDGTGVSHRKSKEVQREFRKQYESFIQREDVPEDVKDGVKQYFNGLHAAEPAPEAPAPEPAPVK